MLFTTGAHAEFIVYIGKESTKQLLCTGVGYRWSRTNVIAAASVFLLEMKFSFDEWGNVYSDLGVVCFLNPYLEKKRNENINEQTLAPLHVCSQDYFQGLQKNWNWNYLSIEEEMKNMKCKHERMPVSFEIFSSEIITALYQRSKGEKFHIPVYSK